MPELPEVEVTRRKLAPVLVGRRIEAVETTAPSYFFLTAPHTLRRRLKFKTVTDLTRKGKYLLARLDDDAALLMHLGMTGQLFSDGLASVRLLRSTAAATLAPEGQQAFEPDAHTHLRLRLQGQGGDVFFRDPRKFGKVQWLGPGERSTRLDKLGVDALEASADCLFPAAQRRKVPIKTLLLDQSVLAGVGNIYADEALFKVGLSPLRPANRVEEKACVRLVEAVQQVMLRSIETGGSSISDYVHPDGERGAFQDERGIYGRAGESCGRCAGTVERQVIGGRASHFCAGCQR